jgi:hypothetical protein
MEKQIFNRLIIAGSLLFFLGTGYELILLNQAIRIEQILMGFFVIPCFISAIYKIIIANKSIE